MAQDAAGAVGARVTNQVDSLIRAAQRGDQGAFEQLVRAYDQSVLRLAMNLLRSPEDARDVYQEAFLRVYRNLHAFRFEFRLFRFFGYFYFFVPFAFGDFRPARGELMRQSWLRRERKSRHRSQRDARPRRVTPRNAA